MDYSSQNATFRRDKKQFFFQANAENDIESRITMAERRVSAMNYSFLLENKTTLEAEFIEMFTVLQKQEGEQKEAFWLYCYYCASLLELFHRSYLQTNKEEHYKDLKNKILLRLRKQVKKTEDDEQSFIQSLYSSFLGSLNNLVNAPFHISQIRDYIAFANLCRLYWAFCRLTMTQGLLLARDLHLIEQLDVILGTHTNVDKIISVFQAPIGVLNYFSIGFFLARFMIDGGLLLKHTFLPTELEKGSECAIYSKDKLPGASEIDEYRRSYMVINDNETHNLYYIPKTGSPQLIKVPDGKTLSELLTKFNGLDELILNSNEVQTLITDNTNHAPEKTTCFERFKFELYKRHCNFANDLLWSTVNFLTNFNHISGIPGPIASYITATFLVFDVGMALYKCSLAKQEYLSKKSQYLQEIEEYSDRNLYHTLTDAQRLMHIDMLNKQIYELEISWRTKEATFYFVAAAAALLMMGFTASVLVSPPMLVLGCFFVCTIAIAMYLSSGAYSQYQEKSLYLEQAQLTGKHLEIAQKEYEVARTEFFYSMTKNTFMPMILITTYAICWPAAIALTAIYMGSELLHAYNQHSDTNEVKRLGFSH